VSVLASVDARSAGCEVGPETGVISACDKVLSNVKQLSLVNSTQITLKHKFKHYNKDKLWPSVLCPPQVFAFPREQRMAP